MSFSDEAHVVLAKAWALLKTLEQDIMSNPAVKAAGVAIEGAAEAAIETVAEAAVQTATNSIAGEAAKVAAEMVAGAVVGAASVAK